MRMEDLDQEYLADAEQRRAAHLRRIEARRRRNAPAAIDDPAVLESIRTDWRNGHGVQTPARKKKGKGS